MKDFLLDALPMILPSVVSIVAIVSSAYQIKMQKHISEMNLYVGMQQQAYFNFFNEIADISEAPAQKDWRRFWAATYQACIVSSDEAGVRIIAFANAYSSHYENPTDEKITCEYKSQFALLFFALQKELSQYNKTQEKLQKLRNKQRRKYNKSNCDEK